MRKVHSFLSTKIRVSRLEMLHLLVYYNECVVQGCLTDQKLHKMKLFEMINQEFKAQGE